MIVKFTVAAPFNFTTNSYVVVFNTEGTSGSAQSQTPEAYAALTNYANWDVALIVSQPPTTSGPTAYVCDFFRNAGTIVPVLLQVPTVPGQVILNPNSNGIQTQFSVQFPISLAEYLASATPSPSPSGSATASPTPSPTPTATATATATASAGASASPSASPTAPSYNFSNVWYWNYFVVSGPVGCNGNAIASTSLIDSLGSGGGSDNTYVDPQELDINTTFDTGTFNAFPLNNGNLSDQTAQIVSGEISNTVGP